MSISKRFIHSPCVNVLRIRLPHIWFSVFHMPIFIVNVQFYRAQMKTKGSCIAVCSFGAN